MSKIAIKQNKKGTFLDLSEEEIEGKSFIKEFSNFSKEISGFLAGTSVSLIMPSEAEDYVSLIEMMKRELNKNNISLKNIMSSDEKIVSSSTSLEMKMSQEESSKQEKKEVLDVSTLPETLYVEANLRSGQLIRYPGNVFILGDVNPSAEIIAAGDIIIWGTLRGLAHAGADGDSSAKIIAMVINAGQIRIANKISSIPGSMAKDKNRSREKVPMLVKIENNEIIANRYFK